MSSLDEIEIKQEDIDDAQCRHPYWNPIAIAVYRFYRKDIKYKGRSAVYVTFDSERIEIAFDYGDDDIVMYNYDLGVANWFNELYQGGKYNVDPFTLIIDKDKKIAYMKEYGPMFDEGGNDAE